MKKVEGQRKLIFENSSFCNYFFGNLMCVEWWSGGKQLPLSNIWFQASLLCKEKHLAQIIADREQVTEKYFWLEDKFWPQVAVAVNVQSLLHANSRYLFYLVRHLQVDNFRFLNFVSSSFLARDIVIIRFIGKTGNRIF